MQQIGELPDSLAKVTSGLLAECRSLPRATKIICRSLQDGKRFAFNQPHRQ